MLEPRAKLGPYSVTKRLGDGPHGRTFLVRRARQKAVRVLKLLHRREDDPPILPEGRLLQLRSDIARVSLDHPNILAPEDVGLGPEDGDEPQSLFVVTPQADGADIFRFTARCAWATTLEVFASLLRGLEALHAQGVNHGHLVANNVWVTGQGPRKSARLLDAGYASAVAETFGLVPGCSWAPEALRGEAVDRRADLYDLGCLLFRCATRQEPFPGLEDDALVAAHLATEAPRARAVKRSVPVAVDELIAALLAKEPSDRPPCANAVIRELNRRASKRFSLESRYVCLAQPLRPPLQGRADELARLTTALTAPAQGAAVVVVESEPGAGRTRLLAELRRAVGAARPEATWLAPPEPTATALAEAAAQTGPAAAGEMAAFGEAASLSLRSDGDALRALRGRRAEALSRAVGEAAQSGPTVIAIDDIHRGDALLSEALARFAYDATPAPPPEAEDDVAPAPPPDVRIVVTLAPQELVGQPAEAAVRRLLAAPNVVRVPFDALAGSEVAEAVMNALGRPVEDAGPVAEEIVAGAGGGLIGALQRAGELAARGDLPAPDGAWAVEPASVRGEEAGLPATLARRLEALEDEAAARLLGLLAVSDPSPLEGEVAAAALGVTDVEARGRALLLERPGWCRRTPAGFVLAGRSIADAVLAAGIPADLDEAHAALGRALADRAAQHPRADRRVAAAAASHLLRSGAPQLGVPLALLAAEAALARGDASGAAWLLDRAADAAQQGPVAPRATPTPLPAEAVLPSSAGAQARCWQLLSLASLASGRAAAARSQSLKACNAAREARDPNGLVAGLVAASRAALAAGDPSEAKAAAEEAAEVARGAGWGHAVAAALECRGAVEAVAGDRDEARASLEEAQRVFREHGDEEGAAGVLLRLAALALERGDAAAAHDALDRARELDDDAERPGAAVQAGLLRSRARLAGGEPEAAQEAAEATGRAAREGRDSAGAAAALEVGAAALQALGDADAAARAWAAAIDAWNRLGASGRIARARHALAKLQLARGALGAADEELGRASEALRGPAAPTGLDQAIAMTAARLDLLRGDLPLASDGIERVLGELGGDAGGDVASLEARALVAAIALAQGDSARAERSAGAVAEAAARQGALAVELEARLTLGQARLQRGRLQDAERELREALSAADGAGELAAQAWAHLGLANVHLIRGEPAPALAEVGHGRDLAHRLGDGVLEVESLLGLGRVHWFLGQTPRARAVLEMALERAQALDLQLAAPRVRLLLARVGLHAAQRAGLEEPDPEQLADVDRQLTLVERAAGRGSRRGLRASADAARAALALLRNDPGEACDRAAAAGEAAALCGDLLVGQAALRLEARARRKQGRHQEALASAERAVSEAEAIRDGEARAQALLERGLAQQEAGDAVAAAQDVREAASHLRGIWAALPEDLRGDYEGKPLVRDIVTAASALAEVVRAAAPAQPAPAAPAPAAAAPAAVPAAVAGEEDGQVALRDPLTNLYNHTFFTAQLENELKRGVRHSRPLALLKINIDRFKLVRELYGPKAAKAVIKEVAELLLRNVRDVDIVARYFGDEFEVLLPDTDQRGALLTAQRIAEAAWSHRFQHEDEKIELTLTLGAAVFPRDAKDKDALICRVDEALYNARSRGPNQIFTFGGAEEAPRAATPELRELDQLMLTREGRTILSMVQRLVNQELDIDRVIELVTGMVVEATRGERGFIMLKGPSGEFSFRHGRNIDDKVVNTPELEISNTIAMDVARTGKAVHVSEAIEDDRFRDFKSVMDLGLRSIICAPITLAGEVLGVVYVDHNQVARNFTAEDLNFLAAIADKVAVPINNSKRLRETEDRLALAEARLQSQAAQLQTKYQYESIIGRSEAMQNVFKLLDRIVETTHSVVIHGESGTGKELIARAIHFNGPRKSKPFVAENCAALSDTLLEAELFGHVKGAFTGADRDSKGLFELANGGTLFLDEIGDMSERMQKKLLRVLQEGEVRPVGGKRVFHVDVRIVSASNKDLKKLVQERKFREDLYYRLNVITVNLPPLRDRRDDIVLLAEFFIQKHCDAGAERELDRETLRHLMSYDWPGNVRELENEINRLVAMSDDVITPDVLSPKIREGSQPTAKASDGMGKYFGRALKEVEFEFMREVITHTLEQTNWHRTKAAQILKVPTSTLFNKMKKYGIG